MITNCPNLKCTPALNPDLKTGSIVRYGTYFRKTDSRKIKRFFCKRCETHFSRSTHLPTYRQKKRRINEPLKKLICSGVSQRRAAIILGVNPKTVVRRFRFLANQARLDHQDWLQRYQQAPLEMIQFDDLETSEHTKCKPLSVALAVDPNHLKVLNYQVAQMPAKGHLAKLSRAKYGYRPDQRSIAWDQMMKDLVGYVSPTAVWTSDENPHYPKYLFKHHQTAKHTTVKGGRGCVSGQGELKKLKYDPIFALNHTCAMLRANMNRLFRKTWCTTKNKQGLLDHLALFVSYYNRSITPDSTPKGGS